MRSRFKVLTGFGHVYGRTSRRAWCQVQKWRINEDVLELIMKALASF